MSQSSKILIALASLACLAVLGAEAKLLRRQRFYEDGGAYDGGFGGSPYMGSSAMPTGERALLTVRGARSPYDGSAPSKIAIEDEPFRGPYPRGVYDRLDGGRPAMYPRPSGLFGGYGMDMPYGGGANGGYGRQQMYGAPARIAVTGAFPYGYGSRY